jgi:ATP-binding cassette subfamily B protein
MARPEHLAESVSVLRRFARRFAPELLRQRALVLGSFAAVFIEVGLRLVEPWPLALVIDHVLGLGSAGQRAALPGLDSLDHHTLLWIAALLLLVVTALRAASAYLSTVGFALAGNRVLTEVRNALYTQLQQLSVAFHTKARSGDLVLRVVGDVGMVKEVMVTAVLPLVANGLVLVGMLIVMLWMQWKLTLIALATVPLFWLSMARLSGGIRAVARKQRRREGNLATRAAETLGGIQTMQALALDSEFAAGFVQQNEGSMLEGVKAKRLSARLERTVDVLVALSTALVLYFGARTVLNGGLSPGQLVVFLTYLKSASRPVRNFAKYTARVAKASAAAERVLEIFDQWPEGFDRPDAVDAPPFHGEIRFDAVTFAYGDEEPVLEEIDLVVRPGERVAVIGASGAGKSTLVGAILRLHEPLSGRILIDGRDIREFTLASLRNQIGVVLQDTTLFAGTIRENIALGTPDVAPEEVEAAARAANAHGFIAALPAGYDTNVGERGLDFSAGQRQRIAIARASVRRSAIVILDEPLSGLDVGSAHVVSEALDRLTEGRTSLLVTHDLHQAALQDRIVVLHNGGIAEVGDHDALMKSRGYYHALYMKESRPDSAIRGSANALRV